MEVIRQDVVTVGGVQSQFIGVQVGEFLLRPDSDSGLRPDDLRVQGHFITVVIEGGKAPLRVRLHSEGISCRGFLSHISAEERNILSKLAADLTGRVWPDTGETLRQRIDILEEGKVLKALQDLFKGVEWIRQ